MSKKVTLEEWKERFISVHGNKYNYSKLTEFKANEKICIICPKHGEFWQNANNHYHGYGCPMCGLEKAVQTNKNKSEKVGNEFEQRADLIHDHRYDYSKSKYINANTKVCIICPEHGEFWQKPSIHLSGHGCPKCNPSNKMDNADFIDKAKAVHGFKYNYTKTKYENSKKKVCIICPEHGEFLQTPNDHLNGHGCYKCNCHNNVKDFSDFKEKADYIHRNKYTYDNSTYVDRQTKTKIICSEHGEFWQMPSIHLSGCGCPKCGNKYNASEQRLYDLLKENFPNEEIIYQYRNKDLLGRMSFDIYFPKYKIAIEHQGIQHFEPIKIFGGNKKLNETIARDKLKKNICEANNIKLLYVSFSEDMKKYIGRKNDIIFTEIEIIQKINDILKNYG